MKRPTAQPGGLWPVGEVLPSEADPWWRSDEKLLCAVIDRARLDSKLAEQLVAAVGQLARDDANLRELLKSEITANRRGPRKTAYWRDVLLVAEYDMIRAKDGLSAELAFEWLAERYCKTSGSMRNRVSQALKRVAQADRQSFDFGNGVTD